MDSLQAKPKRNPFLTGNYAPVKEEVTIEKLRVVGRLPKDLQGMFVRNGPNPQHPPKGRYHWFDGDGMLHGLRLLNGQASYRNRYVRTEGWQEEKKAGKSLFNGMLGMPDLRKLFQGREAFKNVANTALVWHDGKLLALWEGGAPHEIKVPDLDTVGRCTFKKQLKHAFTAHPKVDPQTGEMMFFGYQPVKPYLRYSVLNAKGQLTHTTPIGLPRPVMMHDFVITNKHSVFLDLPVVFDMAGAFRGRPPLKFDPKHNSRIGVLPRHGKGESIKWFNVDPCFVVHTLNAFETGDEVVVHACRMEDFSLLFLPPEQTKPTSKTLGYLYEWRLNLKSGKVREKPLHDQPEDFPRINESRIGLNARFGYTLRLSRDAHFKHDLKTGKIEKHEHGKGRLADEGIFVARPESKREDDGWLLTLVYDQKRGKSELVIVDTRAFDKKPVARVMLPVRAPFGFHGLWLDDSNL